MSVERQHRRSLRRVVFWRCVGAMFLVPHMLFKGIAQVFNGLADLFAEFQDAAMFMELDAARNYQLITGTDLALASGDESRYELLDPDRAEQVRREALVEDDDFDE